MSELLPCPFCGGEAEMGVNKDSTVREYFVGCMNCHIRLYKIGYKRFYTEAEAIAAWNTRAERTCYDVNASAREHGAHCFLWRCSNCDESYDTEMESMNYCPNCGARVTKSDQDL